MKLYALLMLLILAGAIFAFSGDSGGSNSGSGNSGGSSDSSLREKNDSGSDSAQDLAEANDSSRGSSDDLNASGQDGSDDTNDDKGGLRNRTGANTRKFMMGDRELPCGNESTMRERVTCRLEQKEESAKLYYVPEECRVMANDTERAQCLERYDDVQSCRDLDGHEARFACVKEKLAIRASIVEMRRQCAASNDTSTCMHDLREKVFNLAKFKIYNLENVVERLMKAGLDNQTGTDFIAVLEQDKLDFNNAQTIDEKKAVLKTVMEQWKAFVKQAREQIGAANREDNSTVSNERENQRGENESGKNQSGENETSTASNESEENGSN